MTNKKAFYQMNEYLSLWKKALDDKSLNMSLANKVIAGGPYKNILDLGTGSGAQVRRNIEWGLLENGGAIAGIDVNRDGLEDSIEDYRAWAEKNGYKIKPRKEDNSAVLEFDLVNSNGSTYQVNLYCASVYDLDKTKTGRGNFDLVTALSLFEHTDIKRALKGAKQIMKPGAYLYTPSNYNGTTRVSPLAEGLTQARNNALMTLFNEVIINRQNVGGVDIGESFCGDVLPQIALEQGFQVMGAEDSNWLIDGNSNPHQRAAYELFIRSIRNGLLHIEDKEKRKIKAELRVSDLEIKLWYKSARAHFKNRTGTFFCTNKDILLRK